MRHTILFLVFIMTLSLVHGQSDTTKDNKKTALLCFYRKQQFVGSGNGIGIQINLNKVKKISSGRRVILEVNTEDSSLEITTSNLFNNPTAHTVLNIITKAGQTYYIETNWDDVYDSTRHDSVKILGLGINFILKDEKLGKAEFTNDNNFKDKQDNIETIKVTKTNR